MSIDIAAAQRRVLVLAEGSFGVLESKTAASFIRYCAEQVVAVVDSRSRCRDAGEILRFGHGIPVVDSVQSGLAYQPNTLLIGIAPPGGGLPASWRAAVLAAIDAGLHVISGLHWFLGEDPEFAAAAAESGVTLWDARRPPTDLPVAKARAAAVAATVVHTVGTDCRVGKMVTCLELTRAAQCRGCSARFVPTGQTGIMIAGWGISVDAVIADFVAGAAEKMVLEAGGDADVLFVEGQGSIIHPGYSGVTLGLLHGTMPDALILCHQPSLQRLRGYDITLPSLSEFIRAYETVAGFVCPAPVIGIALNCFDLSECDTDAAIAAAEAATGLPATDVVRRGVDKLLDAVDRFRRADS